MVMGETKAYKTVETQQDLDHLATYLSQFEIISYDIETNSKDEIKAEVIGIGVSGQRNTGWYIPFKYWDGDALVRHPLFSTEEEELQFMKDFHQYLLEEKKIIGHNIVYDVTVIWHRYQINVTKAVYSDTILLKHTLDEERPFALKDLAVKYQKEIGIPEEEVANHEQLELKKNVMEKGGKWNQKAKDMYMADLAIIAKYCCADVDITLKLFEYFSQVLKKEDLEEFFYKQEVMPLYLNCTIPMKMNGLFIDVEHFKKLEKELECGIIELETQIFDIIEKDIEPRVRKILDKYVPASKSGKFAAKVLQHYKLSPPINGKTGKPTFAKKELQSLYAQHPTNKALRWLTYEPIKASPLVLNINEEGKPIDSAWGHWCQTKPQRVYDVDPDEPQLPRKVLYAVKKEIYVEKKPNLPHVFNLSSNEHLSWLIFKKYQRKPESFSKITGEPQVDKKSIAKYNDLAFVEPLLKLKKEEKILTTYVRPIIVGQVDGWIYPSMQQFGTTSGRYSCKDPNFQNLPADDLRVKKGIIAPPGYKLVNADFSALEPRCFAEASQDPNLIRVYKEGLDLYSQIAIDVFKLEDVSACESDDNYLKKVSPEYRQTTKVFALAVVYGANAWRIAEVLQVTPDRAQEIIDRYLDAYPYLRDYMENMEILARERGKVWTAFGRVRHLPDAKRLYRGDEETSGYGNVLYKKWLMTNSFGKEVGTEVYYKFRNMMNNAKNFPIQGTAAHITNHAMIKMARLMKENEIDGWLALQIHDELCCIIREDQINIATELLKDAMENNVITRQMEVPMVAEPKIAANLSEAK